MFRVTLFTIVLSLAVGQNATLLCKAWCDPVDAATSGCHHRDGDSSNSPSLVGDDSCDKVVPGEAGFLREDGRRRVSAPQSDHAMAVPRYQVVTAMTDARPGYEPGHLPSLEKRPLGTALRL